MCSCVNTTDKVKFKHLSRIDNYNLDSSYYISTTSKMSSHIAIGW